MAGDIALRASGRFSVSVSTPASRVASRSGCRCLVRSCRLRDTGLPPWFVDWALAHPITTTETPMARFDAQAALPGGQPGPWSEPVPITYDQRDVLLYAVGIGCTDLRFTYEGIRSCGVPDLRHPLGQRRAARSTAALPPSPGPLTIDAERCIEQLAPLPPWGLGTRPRPCGRACWRAPPRQGRALVHRAESEVQRRRRHACACACSTASSAAAWRRWATSNPSKAAARPAR
jgi:hypothetical protein